MKGFLKVPYVRTKEGMGRYAAKMYSPERVKQAFESQVLAFLKQKEFEVKRLDGEVTLEVDLATTVIADAVAIVPGIKRLDGRTVQYTSSNYSDIFHMILTIAMLGGKFAQYT
jgi:D-amino peptidase